MTTAVRALAVCAASLALAACGSQGGERTGSTAAPAADRALLAPARFAQAVARRGTVTLNVHTPDAGSVPGTDLEIPYDRLEARRDELPARSTPLAIYCRSGRMSAIARRTLARMGFRRVVELRGGMEAWRADGRRLLPPDA